MQSVHPAPLRFLPETELQVMMHDGDLVRYGHPCAVAYCSVAHRLTAADRAATLAPIVTGRCAVGGASAVWVHAGGPAPSRITLASPRGARASKGREAGVRYRSTAPPPEAVVLVAGVRVVQPSLALLDMLHDPECTQASIDRAAGLLGLSPARLLAEHPSSRRPYSSLATRRATLTRLLRFDPVDVVDAINAPDRVQDSIQVRSVAHLEGEFADREPGL